MMKPSVVKLLLGMPLGILDVWGKHIRSITCKTQQTSKDVYWNTAKVGIWWRAKPLPSDRWCQVQKCQPLGPSQKTLMLEHAEGLFVFFFSRLFPLVRLCDIGAMLRRPKVASGRMTRRFLVDRKFRCDYPRLRPIWYSPCLSYDPWCWRWSHLLHVPVQF